MKKPELLTPDPQGFYGAFGGAFIPEMLQRNIGELKEAFRQVAADADFAREFLELLCTYCGRPTPMTYSERLSAELGAEVYLKREDLNHTGAHKITNAIGQVLLARRMNKNRIIAETGAGQHGVAAATACALFGLDCIVYMGAKDMDRQAPNVGRMRLLGAEVRAVHSGTKTLKDATNEAIRDWINHPNDTFYMIGSTVGPHPYPEMVTYFQSVISREAQQQLREFGLERPDKVVACIGGGSNAAGAFYHFVNDSRVELIGVEAAGEGLQSGKTAASATLGRPGILHGSMTLLMQSEDGQVVEPHSVSAGLDYPGIGPIHAHLFQTKRLRILTATDAEALQAARWMTRITGIIPALETAHAVAALQKMTCSPGEKVMLCLSGRGDKDLSTYQKYLL